jgi:hypothetical protein
MNSSADLNLMAFFVLVAVMSVALEDQDKDVGIILEWMFVKYDTMM